MQEITMPCVHCLCDIRQTVQGHTIRTLYTSGRPIRLGWLSSRSNKVLSKVLEFSNKFAGSLLIRTIIVTLLHVLIIGVGEVNLRATLTFTES